VGVARLVALSMVKVDMAPLIAPPDGEQSRVVAGRAN
jgi:hypothetical protein